MPDLGRYVPEGGIEDRLAAYDRTAFDVEELTGPAWPPYKRWLSIGARETVIARIWRPKETSTRSNP